MRHPLGNDCRIIAMTNRISLRRTSNEMSISTPISRHSPTNLAINAAPAAGQRVSLTWPNQYMPAEIRLMRRMGSVGIRVFVTRASTAIALMLPAVMTMVLLMAMPSGPKTGFITRLRANSMGSIGIVTQKVSTGLPIAVRLAVMVE